MIIDMNDPSDPNRDRNLRAFDQATGAEIRHVTRVDSENGELTRLLEDESGALTWADDESGELATETVRIPYRVTDLDTGETVCEAA